MDTVVVTAKSIATYKNKKILSTILNTLKQLMFLIIIKRFVFDNNSTMAIIYICSATAIGTYMAHIIFDNFEKEKIYYIDITPPNKKEGKFLADKLNKNFAIKTYKGFINKEEVLCCKVFTTSKKETKDALSCIPENYKYHIMETQNYSS
jgi:hypothetical protein